MAGQTGKTTAVGLAIESQFLQPPLSVDTDGAHIIGIDGTNPHRFMNVMPGNGMDGNAKVEVLSELDGSVERSRSALTEKDYKGEHTVNIDPEVLYYLLLGILGRDVQTAVGTSDPALYQHDLKVGLYVPSFSLEEKLGDGSVFGRVSSGVVIPSLSMTWAEILTAKPSFYGHAHVPNTYNDVDYEFNATPSLIPPRMGGDGAKLWKTTPDPLFCNVDQGQTGSGPLVFGGHTFGTQLGFDSAFFTVDGVAVPSARLKKGGSMDLTRKIDSDLISGSGFDKDAPVGSDFMAKGKMPILFEDDTILRAQLRHSTIGFNIRFNGPFMGATGIRESLEIYIPRFKLTNAPLKFPDGPVVLEAEWEGLRDNTLGSSVLCRLVNQFDTTSLGGLHVSPTLPGGLGGWQAL